MLNFNTLFNSRTSLIKILVSLFLVLVLTTTANAASKPFELKELSESEAGQIDIKLYVFECGRILVRDLSIFNPAIPQGTKKVLSDTCYLIVHPKGTLLWDAGLPDELINQPGGVDIFDGAFNLSVTQTLKSQLAKMEIDPLSIDYIAMSHLHSDHTGNANYFLNAKWLIQQPEYDIAFTPEGAAISFDQQTYNLLSNVEILNGHYDVFNDKSVVIVSTPGHTPGHQALYLDLPNTGKILLSGDLYHFYDNRINYGIPVFNTSKRETIHSFVLIDNLLDKLNAKLWIQHDKPFFDGLRLAPGFYY